MISSEALKHERPIHRVTVEQFHRMIEAGVFEDKDRVELIDGEMRDMPPIGPMHNGCTAALNMRFASALADRAVVASQGPLVLDDGTEVYPDLLVLEWREDLYQKSNPSPEAVLLLVEVADSSLRSDRGVKLPMYARAGVRRCWIVDVRRKTVHEHWDPDRFGRRYRQLESVRDGALGLTLAGVDVSIGTAEIFRF